ncbi:MAG: septum site-determining protein MinC [Phenylobacterium sp.]|uniref:septum site-determining protein MinC n=1 Tax=Phenylobacterium sp. TaxID=1871053 RepID=UPI001A5A5A3B|nr:septum site-determining protein MinC [Phenylobacterium sp.]MBL8771469.1 septum site-determining protein MinC [Phenylobacterium sp.]
MDGDALALPTIRVRGRSFMAIVVAPEFPFGDWFAALDRQLEGAPGFFEGRPVVADLAGVAEAVGPQSLPIVLDGLAARNLRLVGVEGVPPGLLRGTRWGDMPTSLHGRDTTLEARSAAPAPAPGALLIDRPVRSGQSIVFDEGDVVVVGPVASGAEVIAAGNVHIYGRLRGRAIAGLKAEESRIFCRQFEAEMVGVGRLYRTAENWGPDLHGRAVQVRCDRGALSFSALD